MNIIEQTGTLVKDKMDRILDSAKIRKQDVKFLKQLVISLQLFTYELKEE